MPELLQVLGFMSVPEPVFTKPTFLVSIRLVAGWILCPARRTITGIYPFADPKRENCVDVYRSFPKTNGNRGKPVNGEAFANAWCMLGRRCGIRVQEAHPSRHLPRPEREGSRRFLLLDRPERFSRLGDNRFLQSVGGAGHFPQREAISGSRAAQKLEGHRSRTGRGVSIPDIWGSLAGPAGAGRQNDRHHPA
jgi:hypothetical protein